MQVEPSPQHHWLQVLVGKWESEMECVMEPGQPPMKSSGSEVVRSIGGLWTVAEGTGLVPGGDDVSSIMTLGFDPERELFIGTFIANCMTKMWCYTGQLDADKRILTLDTEGPNFTNTSITKYQDIIEIVSPNHRRLRSRMLRDDGTWNEFMLVNYRRVGTES